MDMDGKEMERKSSIVPANLFFPLFIFWMGWWALEWMVGRRGM